MSDREKLVELLGDDVCPAPCCEECSLECSEDACIRYMKQSMADHLISNGVTVQKWIPVSERLPEFGQQVLVSCAGYKLDYVTAMNFWSDKSCDWVSVTHWMPLPEPPKECE